MKRQRIYVDTSVFGGCLDPEFAEWSNALMDDFRSGRFALVVSDVTLGEVAMAPEPVREVVRRIRDQDAQLLRGKSNEEIMEFFRKAGKQFRKRARTRSRAPANKRMQRSARKARRG